jgi:hypothetical protein
VQGELVPIADPEALSQALVRAWRRAPPFDGRKFPLPAIFDEMNSTVAAGKLIELAARGAVPPSRKAA